MRKITFLLLTFLPFILLGQNLAPNPTINGSSDWNDLSPGATQAYDAGFSRSSDGSGSYLINSNGTYNSGIKSANIAQSSLTAGDYVFRYYVYGTAGDKTKPIVRDNGISSNIEGNIYTIQADNTWELVEQTFSISATGTVNLRALVNSNDNTMDFHVDDISFEFVPPTGNVLTVNTNGSGTVNLTLNKTSYDPTDNETLTANPSTHWNFDSWSGDLTGSANPETLMMDADKTVTANFVVNPAFDYNFGFDSDGDLEGWTMDPQVSVATHTGGLVTLSITENQWARFNLFDFPIPATKSDEPSRYNKVTIVVKNEEASTDQLGVTLGPNNNTRTFALASSSNFQTFEVDLTDFEDWTGDVESFRVRFADADNPTNTGRPSVSHNVIIDSIVFSYDATLYLDDTETGNFIIYPNPSSNLIKVVSANDVKSIRVFDSTGRLVKKIETSSFTKEFSVSDMTSGMYIIQLSFENGKFFSKKVVVNGK